MPLLEYGYVEKMTDTGHLHASKRPGVAGALSLLLELAIRLFAVVFPIGSFANEIGRLHLEDRSEFLKVDQVDYANAAAL